MHPNFEAADLEALRSKAKRRMVASLLGLVLVGVAAWVSRKEPYNAIFGPFALDAERLVNAKSLDEFGLQRYFVVQVEEVTHTGFGMMQYWAQGDSALHAEVGFSAHFLALWVRDRQLIARTPRPPESTELRGYLRVLPPDLSAMLDREAAQLAHPNRLPFLLEEVPQPHTWIIEWALMAAAALVLLQFVRKYLRAIDDPALMVEAKPSVPSVEEPWS